MSEYRGDIEWRRNYSIQELEQMGGKGITRCKAYERRGGWAQGICHERQAGFNAIEMLSALRKLVVYDVLCMCNELCFLIFLFGLVAELAYDKKKHRKLFEGEIEFERFYRYLWYAALNTFMHLADVFLDTMIKLLKNDNEFKAADCFNDTMTKKEGH